MLDVKRVLKAAPTKMRSREPLRQLWTPWGEKIRDEWLSSHAGNKAFPGDESFHSTFRMTQGDGDGSRRGRTPVLNEHPRPTMVRDNFTMLNGLWDYAIVPISSGGDAAARRKSLHRLTRDEAVRAVKEAAIPETYDGEILVPFSPESALSGVHQTIYPDDLLWYRTTVHPVSLDGDARIRQIGDANRLILHFEAVDYICACFINGQYAGAHIGGYLPFDVDISAFVDSDDTFEIALCVYDSNDSGTQPRGKQKIEREGIWYTAQSGIWQSVWLEIVPEAYLRTLTLKGASDGKLFVRAEIGGDKPNARLRVTVSDPHDGTVVADETIPAGTRKVRAEIETRAERLWSPDDPYLYDVTATLLVGQAVKTSVKQVSRVSEPAAQASLKPVVRQSMEPAVQVPEEQATRPSGETSETSGGSPTERAQVAQTVENLAKPPFVDVVRSYCAFRSVEVKPDMKGVARFHLNGKPLFVKGVLDQGYWPDGLLTAPSDAALVHDITAMKRVGFNMLRKHIKIESARWYYHCDHLGMMVWQDAVSGGGTDGEYNSWTTNRKPTLLRATWNKYRDDTAKHFAALGADDPDYRRDWSRTCDAMVHMLAGHPSIVAWVLFNEGWGQFDACDAAERIHALDPTRPIDATSGWYDQRCGDFHSVHNYFRPLEVYPDKGPLHGYVAEYERKHKRRRRAAQYAVLPVAQHGVRAFVISEFGGLAQLVPGHAAVSRAYGYGEYDSMEDWRSAVRSLLASADALASRGLSGYVYTQVSDVEEELNGLLTYDRRIDKFADRAAEWAGAARGTNMNRTEWARTCNAPACGTDKEQTERKEQPGKKRPQGAKEVKRSGKRK